MAFDLDKTVLAQGDAEEREHFLDNICGTLIHLAVDGFHIAAVTGNSMEELATRFGAWLVEELARKHKTHLLYRFHLFCNGAGVYIHFPEDLGPDPSVDSLVPVRGVRRTFGSQFVDANYVRKTQISPYDACLAVEIAKDQATKWWQAAELEKPGSKLRGTYRINYPDQRNDDRPTPSPENSKARNVEEFQAFNNEGEPKPPKVSERGVTANDNKKYVPQIAVKDILSHHHAWEFMNPEDDERSRLVRELSKAFKMKGLALAVTPGGRGTIDIARLGTNKKKAMEFLVDSLGVQGYEEDGEEFGTNVLYFGDEVVLSGNDFPVTEIPGVLVFAVGQGERSPLTPGVRVPFHYIVKLLIGNGLDVNANQKGAETPLRLATAKDHPAGVDIPKAPRSHHIKVEEQSSEYQVPHWTTPSLPFDFESADSNAVSVAQGLFGGENSSQDEFFCAANLNDARVRVIRSIVQRRGQPEFRNKLMQAYGCRCCINGYSEPEVPEAAHIMPYRGDHTNHVTNGLLLRADIHTLFDIGLIAIGEGFKVLIGPNLDRTEYYALRGQALSIPEDPAARPSVKALQWHRQQTGL